MMMMMLSLPTRRYQQNHQREQTLMCLQFRMKLLEAKLDSTRLDECSIVKTIIVLGVRELLLPVNATRPICFKLWSANIKQSQRFFMTIFELVYLQKLIG